MKSYGEKWKDSRAKFSIKSSRNRSSFLAEHEVSGENDVLYSLTYSEKFDLLAAVNRGKSISLSFDLVSGRRHHCDEIVANFNDEHQSDYHYKMALLNYKRRKA
eukprot:scaffold502_cov327-Chaetoceros_neogracile.AAC.2